MNPELTTPGSPTVPPPPEAPVSPPPANAVSERGYEWLLSSVQTGQRRQLWIQGALYGGAVALVLFLLAGYAGLESPRWGRSLFFLMPLSFVGVFCFFGVYRALSTVGDSVRTARWLGVRLPQLSQDVLAAVELSRDLQGEHDFSPDLARAFLKQINERAAVVDGKAALDRSGPKRAAYAMGIAAVCTLTVLSVWPKAWVGGVKAAFGSVATRSESRPEPITGDIELTYRYPAYTGLGPRTVPGTNGEVTAPAGTEVQIKTRADREVERAQLLLSGKPVPLLVTGGRELAGSFVVQQSGTYVFAFLTSGGRELARGGEIPVNVEADAPPRVTILTPAEEIEIDPGQKVVLKYDVTDDYGLTALELVYRLSRSGEEQRIPLPHDEGRRSKGQFSWDLGSFRLSPGDRISYHVAAKDNDEVEGKKTGVSRTHVLKVYSAAEHRREAVRKAEELWERLVGHLGDRLESPDRAKDKDPAKVAAQQSVDHSGFELVGDLTATAQEISRERDSPRELWTALVNISEGLQGRVRTTSDIRKMFLRYHQMGSGDMGTGGRLSRVVDEEIGETERDVLYLESLLDRQKVRDLKEMASELARERRELASLIERYKQTQDPKLQEGILKQVQNLKERINELMARMSEMAKGIRDEHLNAEALKDLMKEKDLSQALDDVEKLVREGKSDEALAKLQELAMQMEEMVKGLDDADQEFGSEQYSELTEKFQEFMGQLQKTTQEQQQVSDRTKEIRNRYKEQVRERLKSRGQSLKEQLLKSVNEVSKDYKQIQPDQLNSRADGPLEEVQAELENVRNALKVDDFDLAAESADRADRAAQELSMYGEQQRQLDEVFQNPANVRGQSRQLAERLNRDANKVQDVNQRLQQLFPQPGSLLSEQDRAQLKQLSQEQRQLEQQAQRLQQKMDEMGQMAPVFGQEAEDQMNQIAQRMGEASERMEGRDPGKGYAEQKAALDQLQQFQKQMQESKGQGKGGQGMPLPMFAGGHRGGWGRNSSQEKVEIPDADQHQAPKEFRQDLLDAMKQGAPDKYKEQVKRYYEELVK